MPKTTLILAVVCLIFLVPALGYAAGIDIPGSKHDLSVPSDSAGYSSCYICHSPHTIASSHQPLWNQDAETDQFTAYNSSEHGYQALKEDGGVSICLSCHDGTFAALSIYIESSMNPGEQQAPGFTGRGKGPGPDHPVNISYFDSETDPDIRPAVSPDEVTDGEISLTLYNGRVQCGSCHDVHNGYGESFLRISNEGSQLCYVCHLK